MKFKQIIQDYFTFNRKERKGITIFLAVIFMLAVANRIIYYFETPAKIDTQLLNAPIIEPSQNKGTVNNPVKQNKLFSFNPNTISREGLDSLLLPEGIKRNMLKFREKGGKYYSEADFRKMYGVTDSIYQKLAPFLLFENKKVQTTKVIIPVKLFTFDPNTTSDKDLLRLGLTEKQIQTIRNYQNKGGIFRRPADFLKIYALSQSQKDALASYIEIEEKGKIVPEKEASTLEIHLEINGTDSIELMRLPGIGNKLSKRIIKYRDLLGGFYALGQLKEVYGLSDKTRLQLETMVQIDTSKIQKVDLNFADWKELARHPYIQKNLASLIIKFRTKFGPINEPSVLRDSMILNIEKYTKLRPYL